MTDLLLKGLSQYGVQEIVGVKHNPTVLEYFKASGHGWVKDDETAWCSAFINWLAKSCGYEHTGKLNARSWLDIGKKIDKPEPGDIVIFWRIKPDSPYGHVAIFINEDEDESHINVLGGNQSNMICISSYDKERVLGYRRLKCK